MGGGRPSLSLVKDKQVGKTTNEKGIAVDALSRYELQILSRSEKGPTALRSTFPVEEADQFGFQDPPALARLGGLDATIAYVFKKGRLGNSQVLTGFLGRQDFIIKLFNQSLSPHVDKSYGNQICIFYANTQGIDF